MKLLVVEKNTRWSEISDPTQAQSNPSRMSGHHLKLFNAHKEHIETIGKLKGALADHDVAVTYRKVDSISEEDKAHDDFDAVITVGGAGTVLYASHQVNAPILAINSSPSSSAGFYCADQPPDILVTELLNKSLDTYILTRMSLYLDDKLICDKIMNDVLYCNPCPAIATRYQLRDELQTSSGIWVSTAAGSTAGIRSAGGHTMQLSSRNLQFLVREPYQPRNQKYKYSHGFIKSGGALEVTNYTQNAKVYIDGIQHLVTVEEESKLRAVASGRPLYLLQPIE